MPTHVLAKKRVRIGVSSQYGKKEIETVSLEHRSQEIGFKEKKSPLNKVGSINCFFFLPQVAQNNVLVLWALA